jgi:hypothetical protein
MELVAIYRVARKCVMRKEINSPRHLTASVLAGYKAHILTTIRNTGCMKNTFHMRHCTLDILLQPLFYEKSPLSHHVNVNLV